MKYAIMIYDYANEEQFFIGIKEMVEVRSAIVKGIEEYVGESADTPEDLNEVYLYVIAEDFKGNFDKIVNNKELTLNDFFNNNENACCFSLDKICSFSKVKVTI